MRKGILSIGAAAAALTLGLTACGGESGDTSAQSGSSAAPSAADNAKAGKIGVILPDSKSSARWETADRKYLEEAFKTAGVQYDIQNAQGDKSAFQTIADQMITNGATVLMIVNLDSGTGKAVLDKAKSQGVATIDYDRLTLGGSAAYYVSFDNNKVGQLQGEGLVKCLTDKKADKPIIAELNGSPTDNNATLFKEGYDSVLKPKYDSGDYKKGPDQSVPDWDNTQAGTIFEQMLTQEPKIAGVLSANDGLGNAAISVLKKQNLNGKVPVTGQDATVQGLQNILAGDQCMTVYKAIKKEADAASQLAIGLAKGEQPSVSGSVKDPEGNRDVPSVLLEPQAIYFDNVKDVVADGFVTKDELCTGDFADKCKEAGIS
ncbi:sugar ABC transporter substrate-binding protein [Microbispora triticiradicis]|uniref:Sugar ABC transporter substrate-binding protein n=3 Tax=Microbispora TaxID=2005 RepID=A0ABY3LQA9_9ACTN|nr:MULTISPECIES: substrate-binding domain-containing protein [Microbispora]RGA06094.1 sugar ABC transporter substrate-binding protein [Microbispora triticiradicis]TLP63733.1 sugar ABC transporter substrate-binding protein [Microbispora fusca]TYB47306.1 sugar ABC transporter substrate-binding protein [Microbispora tritici]GLW20453.1 sugar ABC transporter substrate-binding protein [Microbispora amethystogenes]